MANVKDNEQRKFYNPTPREAWVRVKIEKNAEAHTVAELQTIDTLGLTINNMLTDTTEYDIITDNSGQILFAGTVE